MKNIKGYTLVEIAIVMLIISIMAIVVKGTYDGTVEKSKWSEPYTVIGKIIDAQKEYHVLNDKFANNFDELNLHIDGKKNQDATNIETQYFRYKTEADSDGSTCKISVARMLGAQTAEATIALIYFDKDDEHGNTGNTFSVTTNGEVSVGADFKSQPAIREAKKLMDFFASKS